MRSPGSPDFWGRILASTLERPLLYRSGGEVGPAFGAARLGRLAVTGEDPVTVCTSPALEREVLPEADLSERYRDKLERYRRLYVELRSSFTASP